MKESLNKNIKLENRFWRIVTSDEKIKDKVLELTQNFVQGPVKPTSIIHSLYRERSQPSYDVPYSVVEWMYKNRESYNYKFDTFSRVSKQVGFSAYTGMGTSAKENLKGVFNKAPAVNNPRNASYQTREVRIS